MNKRKVKMLDAACTNSKVTKNNSNWSLALLESMKDPKLIIKQTDKAVVITDKYPKAKIHYLVLPHDDIKSIYNLKSEHLELLQEFGKLYEEIKENERCDLRAGFHAVPSMQRLHMHIISTDMISQCLKTKKHWNSFTTKFFIPCKDLLKAIEEDGCIKKISNEEYKSLMDTPLICNQCEHKPKNMPQLKEHLLSHNK